MRTTTSLLLILLLAAPAWAGKAAPEKSAADVVRDLGALVEAADTPRHDVWVAYLAAKDAIGGAAGEAKEEAEGAYEAIKGRVASALYRDAIPLGGWLMGLFAALLLWGGFFTCLRIALRSGASPELDEDETWPIRPDEP